MGKIHKALEKSKKEQQQSKKNPYHSFKAKRKLNQKPRNLSGESRDRIKSQATVDKDLGAIHNLLNDPTNIGSADRSAKSTSIVQKTPTKLKSNTKKLTPGGKVDVKIERNIGTETSTKDNEEQSENWMPEEDIHLIDNAVDVVRNQQTQENMSQKIVSLKNNKKSESIVRYIEDDNYVAPTEENQASHQLDINSSKPTRIHYSLVTLGKPKSFEAEQFKILRANLLFPKSGKPPKTILLTSAVPGEGKTFTAMNLAVSLAQNINSYVLLVDADIRKPEVHKRFGFGDNIYGLSDFLTQDMPLHSLLMKTPLSNLTILPGGQATINPSELISSEKMKQLLNELSSRYSDRYVIIDAPPPKLAAETYALARFVEHIIPVVRSGRSNRELVDEMMNLLGREKIQGVVLNCYDIRNTKRFGYHKYSEYYT